MSNWSFIIVFFNQMRMLAFSYVNCEKNIACHASSYVIVLEIILKDINDCNVMIFAACSEFNEFNS